MTSPSFHNPSTHFACCWVRCKTPSCRVGNLSNPPQNWLGRVRCGQCVAACPCTSHRHASCAHKLYLQPTALVQLHCWEDKAQCNGICWKTVASVARTNIFFFTGDTAILKNKVSVRMGDSHSDAAEDSSLLGRDTMSLGEWCPRSCAPSYSVSSSARRIRLAMQHSVWRSTSLESSIMWPRCSVVQHTVTINTVTKQAKNCMTLIPGSKRDSLQVLPRYLPNRYQTLSGSKGWRMTPHFGLVS